MKEKDRGERGRVILFWQKINSESEFKRINFISGGLKEN